MQNAINPNQLMLFVTVHDDTNPEIAFEINPAFIIMMQRHEIEFSPFTTLTLTTGNQINVRETPQEISELQMNAMNELIKALMNTTTDAILEMEKRLDDGMMY